ncbi:hypothetical protein VTI28DRAFT_6905 [Corynascus sepedonium]
MADNTNQTSSWFRPFRRSNSSNTAEQQQQQEQQQRQPPPLQSRHTFHHVPAPFSNLAESPTAAESPSKGHHHFHHHHHNQHQHHHRKTAGATLRTVSSFLSLKSGANKSSSGDGHGYVLPSSSSFDGRTAAAAMIVAKLECEPTIRTPASLAMLPLTEVEDDFSSSHYADGRYGTGVGTRSRSGSGRSVDGAGKNTWHNPSLMQMTEMLSSVMARMGPGDRLDPTYHSCVLSLIEGFYKVSRKLRDAEEQLAELKDLRERELDQFRSMTEEWMETGEAYKAEVKRLELALAKESKDGVASVALARHGSLVDRVGSKRFHARLKRLNDDRADTGTKEQMPLSGTEPVDLTERTASHRTLSSIPRILDCQNDVALSRIVEQRELEERLVHQRRLGGRIRAAPVLVCPGDAPEPHESLQEMLRAQQPGVSVVTQVVATEGPRELAIANDTAKPNHTISLGGQSSLSIDNESSSSPSPSSSSSSSSSDLTNPKGEPSQSTFNLFRKSNARLKKSEKKTSEFSVSKDRLRNDKVDLSKSGVVTRELSGQQSQQSVFGPSPGREDRRRCYSFQRGDDELLSVTSLHSSSGVYQPQVPSPEENTARVEGNRLVILPGPGPATTDHEVGVTTAILSSSSSSNDSISYSTSADTVKWVGEDGEDGEDGHGDDGAPRDSDSRQEQMREYS